MRLRMNQIEGRIFEIQHFSIHDGPGIRSVVFLQGCPLNCLWCHNPEGQRFERVPMLNAEQCALCGNCMQKCEHVCHQIVDHKHVFRSEACIGCGDCIEGCSIGALHWVGRRMKVEDVLDQVMRDRDFFLESGGGITISGGEPAAQPQFAYALLLEAGRRSLHRAMETSGYAPQVSLKRLAEEVDLFLFDCKETDPQRHLAYTGVDLNVILDNLHMLHDCGKRIRLRCPIIPGCNDREEHIRALGKLCAELPNLEGIELLPYHNLGVSKAARLGKAQQEFDPLPAERMENWREMLRSMGAKVILS